MARSHINKENMPQGKNQSIKSYYKVSKRLFGPNKLDYTSPVSISFQQSSPACDQDDDSPYLYEMRKKQAAPKFHSNGVSGPLYRAINETPLKRSGSSVKQRLCLSSSIMGDDFSEDSDIERSDEIFIDSNNDIVMQIPESSSLLKLLDKAMEIEEEEPLSGDLSQKCVLSVIKGKHPELNTITSETVAWLLLADHGFDVTIIDCRYPYEFDAGHIKGSLNMYLKDRVDEDFFNSEFIKRGTKSERLLLFYCEFSSERAPSMMRFIRKKDRALNEDAYPFVYYPEMYLIDGGYKSFFASFKDLCEPQGYKPMLDKRSTQELVYYKALCKSSNMKLQKDEKR